MTLDAIGPEANDVGDELQAFASENGFGLRKARGNYKGESFEARWMSWGSRAAQLHPAVTLPEIPEPVEDWLSEDLGTLTLAHFVRARLPGWEINDEMQATHNEIREWIEDEDDLEELDREHQEMYEGYYGETQKASEDDYTILATELLNDEGLIALPNVQGLSATVRELRHQLQLAASKVQETNEGGLLDWLRVAYALPPGGVFKRLGSHGEHLMNILIRRIFDGVVYGRSPALLLNHADYFFRRAIELPGFLAGAQLSGFKYLLIQRESVLCHAARVRDKLNIYEPLLNSAVFGVSPLSDDVLEAIREETERYRPSEIGPPEKTTYSYRERFTPHKSEIVARYQESQDSQKSNAARYREVSTLFGDEHSKEFEALYSDRPGYRSDCAYPGEGTIRGYVDKDELAKRSR